MINEFILSFIAMFMILTPFTSMIAFISLTKGDSEREKTKNALIAIGVAFFLLVIFVFAGPFLLQAMGINMDSFKVGGGLVLLLLGIHQVMGQDFKKAHKGKQMAGVLIGTPLLTGPGALMTITVLSEQYGYAIPVLASFSAISITWFMLKYSAVIEKIVGRVAIEAMSRVVGLFITAMAVQFMFGGMKGLGIF